VRNGKRQRKREREEERERDAESLTHGKRENGEPHWWIRTARVAND